MSALAVAGEFLNRLTFRAARDRDSPSWRSRGGRTTGPRLLRTGRSPARAAAWRPSPSRRSPRSGRGRPAAGQARRPRRGHAADRRAGQAALQLHLPDDAGRRLADRRRHDPGRRLGRLLVGPVLGLGPQGGLGPDHAARLPDPAPRPVRRLGQYVLAGLRLGVLLPLGGDGLVRRQLRAGRRACTPTASSRGDRRGR